MPIGFKLDFRLLPVVLSLFCLSNARALAADKASKTVEPPWPQSRQVAAMPSMQVAAKVAGIALEGISAPATRARMQPGDSATFLASLTDGKNWLSGS